MLNQKQAIIKNVCLSRSYLICKRIQRFDGSILVKNVDKVISIKR